MLPTSRGMVLASTVQPPVAGRSNKKKSKPQTKKPRGYASRYIHTDRHDEALLFIDKCFYATLQQVGIWLREDQAATKTLLVSLKNQGYVDIKLNAGSSAAYFVTESGKEMIGSETGFTSQETGSGLVKHQILLGWTILSIFRKPDSLLAKLVRGELKREPVLGDFLTAQDIDSSVYSEMNRVMRLMNAYMRGSKRNSYAKRHEAKQLMAARVDEIALSEAIYRSSYAWAWAVYGEAIPSHTPDLVLKVREVRDGETRAYGVAFEMERTFKPVHMEKVLKTYIHGWGKENISSWGERYEMGASGEIKTTNSPLRAPFIQGKVIYLPGRKTTGDRIQNFLAAYFSDEQVKFYKSQVNIGPTQADLVKPFMQILDAESTEAAARRSANATARSAGLYHLKLNGEVHPCRCGVKCRAWSATALGIAPMKKLDAEALAEDVVAPRGPKSP